MRSLCVSTAFSTWTGKSLQATLQQGAYFQGGAYATKTLLGKDRTFSPLTLQTITESLAVQNNQFPNLSVSLRKMKGFCC